MCVLYNSQTAGDHSPNTEQLKHRTRIDIERSIMSNPALFLMPADEKFNGANWLNFRTTVLAAAKARGLLGYLLGTISPPDPDDSPDATAYWGALLPTSEEWNQRDAYAQSLVTLNVLNPIGQGVAMDGTAATTWESLTSLHDAKSDLGLLNAESALADLQYSEGGDIDAHFAALRTAWNNANAQGADIKDAKFRMIVLKSMPVAWAILISTLAHIPTSTAIITHLTLHATLVRAKAGPATSQSAQALSTQSRRNVRNPHLKCDNCGRLGHTGPDCYREGGGKAGQYPEWWKRDKPTTPATPATVPAANSAVSSTMNPLYLALAATHPTTRSATLVTYADSAASNHFFACRGDFETYGPIPDGTTKGSTANGGDFRMAGTGRVRKNVVHEGRKVQLTFEHAIHTPDLTHNLVSIGCLGARGCSVMFSGNGATFFDQNGTAFMHGEAVGTMYKIHFTTDITVPPRFAALLTHPARSNNSPAPLETWHRRLGHISEATVLAMLRQDLVRGMSMLRKSSDGRCEDCILGKHARRPFDATVDPENPGREELDDARE
ncbi:hypothetical protein D9615_008422 [Tricholomella constricta]|uniref:CCHC-type domain-containing protein n=1 Tax=Tricholomella constricta TaxID=117010 RepID=A0A8H5M5E9_9AGAR|nr:hypothetical protein D9615_008422 [Tricholomella constricta]